MTNYTPTCSQVAKISLHKPFRLTEQHFLQANCPSWCPTDSVKARKTNTLIHVLYLLR